MENHRKKFNHAHFSFKKGILLVKNLNHMTDFFFLRKLFEIFGKIHKSFFIQIISTKRKSRFEKSTEILGWIEYFDKIDAKKASICLNLFKDFPFNKNQKLIIRYQKSLNWKNLMKILQKTAKISV